MTKNTPAYKWFKESIDFGYYNLAGIILEDIDSSIEYNLNFVNGKKLWALDLLNVKNPKSPDVEVDPKLKIDIFHDDLVKKIIKRVSDVLNKLLPVLDNIIMP